MSRPRWQLRDAAVGYAACGIPVLPLHYPLPHRSDLQPVRGDPQPAVGGGCSCRDPGCGQPGKHPLGSLVPHGVNDATCNRARVLAWWTRHPQANIGLATGHRFDVLDLDGRDAIAALRAFADHHRLQLPSGGPVVRSGRAEGGWHYYLAPTGLARRTRVLDRVDFQGAGAYVIAPPSRHATGRAYHWVRDLDHPLPGVPGRLRAELDRHRDQQSAGALVVRLPVADGPGPRYARAALAEELARAAQARVGGRNAQLWESARNLYNLVAAGALDPAEVDRGLLAAAERCGLLDEEPRQTHRTLASARQVGLAHPRHPPQRPDPDPTNSKASPAPRDRADAERSRTPERR